MSPRKSKPAAKSKTQTSMKQFLVSPSKKRKDNGTTPEISPKKVKTSHFENNNNDILENNAKSKTPKKNKKEKVSLLYIHLLMYYFHNVKTNCCIV